MSENAQEAKIVPLGRYFFRLLKMCKNSAGSCFLCVAGSAKRFVLHKEKMASPIVVRPFSFGTRIFQVPNTFLENSLLWPEKVRITKARFRGLLWADLYLKPRVCFLAARALVSEQKIVQRGPLQRLRRGFPGFRKIHVVCMCLWTHV